MSGYNCDCNYELSVSESAGGIAGLESLDAFLDGELDAMSHACVAAAVYSNAEASARLTDYRAQNAELRRLFAEVLEEPVPARMQMLVNSYACEWRQTG